MNNIVKTDRVTCPGTSELLLVAWTQVEPDLIMSKPYHILDNRENGSGWCYDYQGHVSRDYPDQQSCIDAALENAAKPIGIERPSLKTTVNTAGAALLLGVSVRRVQAMINDGRLHAEKDGRDWKIDKADLDAVRERKVGRPKKEV